VNTAKIEEELAKNGFTVKDLAAMRQYLGKDGATYLTLLSELKGRFILSCVLIVILCAVWIYFVFRGEKGDLISFSLTMLVAAPIFYIMTPMKLAFKAFKYMRKN